MHTLRPTLYERAAAPCAAVKVKQAAEHPGQTLLPYGTIVRQHYRQIEGMSWLGYSSSKETSNMVHRS